MNMKNLIKVIHLGNTANVAFELCNKINIVRKEDYRCLLITYKDDIFIDTLKNSTFTYITPETTSTSSLPRKITEIFRIIKKVDPPDIIHTHGLFYFIGSCIKLLYKNEIIWIAHFHGSDIRLLNKKFQALLSKMPSPDLVIVSTPDLLDYAKETISDACCIYLPNPVDTDVFHPKKVGSLRYNKNKYRILFFPHRIEAQVKDIAFPVKMLTVLNKRITRNDYKYLLKLINVGSHRTMLRKIIYEMKLDEYVQWLPWLSQIELAYHINLSDLVIGSIKMGVLPLSTLQAMSCGKIVLEHISDKYLNSYYKNYKKGLILIGSFKDISELASFIDMLLNDDGATRKISHNARKVILMNHDSKLVSTKLTKIYDKLYL